MQASKSKNATKAERLEQIKDAKGIEHARKMRDEHGWRWTRSGLWWTICNHWVPWAAALFAAIAFVSDLTNIFG